jgi:hypothetical protein
MASTTWQQGLHGGPGPPARSNQSLEVGLRDVFKVKGDAGKQALDRWLAWALRCRIPVFVELGRKLNDTSRDPRRPLAILGITLG